MRHGAPAGVVMVAVLSGCTLGFGPGTPGDHGLERVSIETDDGRRLSYLRSGSVTGQRVIFIHGTPGDAGNLAHFLIGEDDDEARQAGGSLAGFELISVDRLGFGQSDQAVETSFEEQARAISALLVERDGRWPILVGHSLGGPIAARLAGDEPDRVGGLVIVAGSLDPALEGPRWFNHLADFPLVYLLLDRSLQHSNREIMAARCQTEALWAVLAEITAPIVIIHGTDDSLVPVDNVAYMQRRFALNGRVRAVVLDGANHFIPWQQSDVIRDAILDLAEPGTQRLPSEAMDAAELD